MPVSEFPKWLHHPHFTPAILHQPGAIDPVTRIRYETPPGKPAAFPPVLVNNPDQEEMYVARGYLPSVFDPASYDRQIHVPLPPGYTHHEYPKWVNGKLVQNAEQEQAAWPTAHQIADAVLDEHDITVVPPEELAEFRRWKAAQAAQADEPHNELEELRQMAAGLNIDIDLRWNSRKLRKVIDLATAPPEKVA